MKTMCVVAALIAVLAVGVVFAQSDSDYQAWMKSNGAAMAALNKSLMAKDAGGVGSSAQTLESNLKQVEAYWQSKGVTDAVNFAKAGQAAAAKVASDASSGNLDAAGADLKGIQGACGGCHMAHREGTAQTGFKMK